MYFGAWEIRLFSICCNFICLGAILTGPVQFLLARGDWAAVIFKHCNISQSMSIFQVMYAKFLKQASNTVPDSKVHGANMGPTRVLSAPDGPHVGPMSLAIRGVVPLHHCQFYSKSSQWTSHISPAWTRYGVCYLGLIYLYSTSVILVISLRKLHVVYAKFMKEELQNRRVYFRIMDLSLIFIIGSLC